MNSEYTAGAAVVIATVIAFTCGYVVGAVNTAQHYKHTYKLEEREE